MRHEKTISQRVEDLAWALALSCLVLGAIFGAIIAGFAGFGRCP